MANSSVIVEERVESHTLLSLASSLRVGLVLITPSSQRAANRLHRWAGSEVDLSVENLFFSRIDLRRRSACWPISFSLGPVVGIYQ